MELGAKKILEAESEELESWLAGVELREWLRTALAHQLDYQRKMTPFDPATYGFGDHGYGIHGMIDAPGSPWL